MKQTELSSFSDNALIKLLGQNEMPAFNELFARHWQSLYHKAYAVLGNTAAAKDIVQEVFFDIWQRRHTLELQHVKAYLEQAVRFQVFKAIRSTKASQRLQEKLSAITEEQKIQDPRLHKDYEELLDHLIEQLPADYREAFRLSRKEQRSYQEISVLLNISERAVEYRIAKALEFFRANYTYLLALLMVTETMREKIFFQILNCFAG